MDGVGWKAWGGAPACGPAQVPPAARPPPVRRQPTPLHPPHRPFSSVIQRPAPALAQQPSWAARLARTLSGEGDPRRVVQAGAGAGGTGGGGAEPARALPGPRMPLFLPSHPPLIPPDPLLQTPL